MLFTLPWKTSQVYLRDQEKLVKENLLCIKKVLCANSPRVSLKDSENCSQMT